MVIYLNLRHLLLAKFKNIGPNAGTFYASVRILVGVCARIV